jgi:FlaG/FlaF family flagellin (archaellin)
MIKDFKDKNKKALSTVVATVLIILLTVVATAIVWTFVKGIVNPEKLEGTQSCFEATSGEKITINDYYTCYNKANNTVQVQFSIDMKDVKVDAVLVSILVGGNSKSFTLTNNDTNIPDLGPYKGNLGDPVKLPGPNEGRTYVAGGFESGAGKVDWIKIAPVINGKQCDSSDETYQIDYCSLYGD